MVNPKIGYDRGARKKKLMKYTLHFMTAIGAAFETRWIVRHLARHYLRTHNRVY